jgi:hypothetical protein
LSKTHKGRNEKTYLIVRKVACVSEVGVDQLALAIAPSLQPQPTVLHTVSTHWRIE